MSLANEYADALAALSIARQNLADHEKAARKDAHDDWVAAGGCSVCNGNGGWSTSYHDGDSVWDECPNKRKGTCSHGTMHPFHWAGIDTDDTVGIALFDAVAVAETKLAEASDALEISKGKTVKVVRGRKVPIGTVGVVFWIGSGQYGERVGIKDANDTVHWTASKNVEVIGDSKKDNRPSNERPTKGKRIKHGNTVGVVFWVGDGGRRIGYNEVKGGRVIKDAIWADAVAVEVVAA